MCSLSRTHFRLFEHAFPRYNTHRFVRTCVLLLEYTSVWSRVWIKYQSVCSNMSCRDRILIMGCPSLPCPSNIFRPLHYTPLFFPPRPFGASLSAAPCFFSSLCPPSFPAINFHFLQYRSAFPASSSLPPSPFLSISPSPSACREQAAARNPRPRSGQPEAKITKRQKQWPTKSLSKSPPNNPFK